MGFTASALDLSGIKLFLLPFCGFDTSKAIAISFDIPKGNGTQKSDCKEALFVPKSVAIVGDNDEIREITCNFFPADDKECAGTSLGSVNGSDSIITFGPLHSLFGGGCQETHFDTSSGSAWYQCVRVQGG